MFVEVKKPYANIYKELDPKSDIIEQAKKGDHLELVFEGTSWYHVKVKNSFGWIEKRAGELTDNPGKVSIFSIIMLVLLVGGTFGGVSLLYLQKQVFQEHDAFSRKLFMNQKIAHTILSVLLLFLTIHAQEKQIEVADYYAKVYLAPNPKSKFIGWLQKGEIYYVINITDYWYRIQFKAAMGWVLRSQFKDYDPSAQTVQQNTDPFADSLTPDTANPLSHAGSIADSVEFKIALQGRRLTSRDTLKRLVPPPGDSASKSHSTAHTGSNSRTETRKIKAQELVYTTKPFFQSTCQATNG